MPFELHYDSKKTQRLIWSSPLVVVIGLVVIATQSDNVIHLIVAAVFVCFGILGFGLANHRLGNRAVVLRIGPNGILDRRLSAQTIRWDQIIAIDAKETGGHYPSQYLDLYVSKSAPVTFGLHVFLWRIAGCRGLPISDDGLNGNFNQILLAAKYFADEYGVPMRI